MRKLLAAAGFVLIGFTGSAQAQFCPGVAPWVFDDVQANDSACPAITWMALNNISLGCQLLGPLDRNYCPNDNVTRKQMALFMNRLGNIRVQEVDTGPGLAGGPITLTGTIGLTATQLLPTTACASGQVPQWNGSKWTCAAAAGGGTVTSVAAGTGLVAVPSPITGSGTLNVAASYQLPQGCTNGQVAKSNGSGGWTCADSSGGGGTVTSITAGAGLLGGTITSSGTIAVDPNSATLTANYFKQGGNTFGAAPALLGNLDDGQPLEIWAAGVRVMRFENSVNSPNVVGGFAGNTANAVFSGGTTGVGGGQTIAGGGYPGSPSSCKNLLGFALGCANLTYSDFATIGGGFANQGVGYGATIAGGYGNWAGLIPPLGSTTYATVSGGYENLAAGSFSAVGGGSSNASGGTAGTVPGGYANSAQGDYSFAAGRGAIARGNGSFVWSDDTGFNFDPDGGPGGWGLYAPNNFNVRATGGIWFLTGIDSSGNPLNGAGVEVLPGNGAWQTYSDRNGKDSIEAVDPEAVLRKLVAVPVATWRWKGEDERYRHMGPMAQDFYAAFHLGANDTHIVTVDAEGVALAAIQGLYAQLKERDATIADQQRQIFDEQREMADQRRTIVEEQREIAELRERLAQVESLRGEIAGLRNAIAAVAKASQVAAQAN